MYDDYMLCKVTLGVLKGASKLNVLFIIIKHLSKHIGATCVDTMYQIPEWPRRADISSATAAAARSWFHRFSPSSK